MGTRPPTSPGKAIGSPTGREQTRLSKARPPGLHGLCLWLSLELILNLAILKHFALIKFILRVLEKGWKTFSFYLGNYVPCVTRGDLLGIHKYNIFSHYDKKE